MNKKGIAVKKAFLGITLILLIIVLSVGFASCSKGGDLKVTFYVDGSEYATVEFNKGDYEIALPADPVVKGKNFVRWEYEKPETGERAEFLKDTIWHYQTSMKVYACFDNNMSNYVVNNSGDTIIALKDNTATEYTIPAQINGKDIEKLGEGLFKDNSNITTITIPKTVQYIEKSAFENCENLTTVTFAEDTEILYLYADVFKNCSSLEELVFPNGLENAQPGLLAGCDSLTKLTTPFVGLRNPNNTSVETKYYCLRTFFGDSTEIPIKDLTITKQKYIISSIFSGSKVEKLTISSEDIDLGSSMSYYIRETLKTVDLSESKGTEIDYAAFEGCTLLTSVKLPSTLETIAGRVFYGCTGIESLDIPAGVTSIGFNAFTGCTNLKNIDISSVQTIGTSAFNGCSGITALDGRSLKTIDYNAFANMNNLATIMLRDVETIGNGAFSGDSKLTSFSNATLTKLKTIGDNTFEGCSLLTTINLAKSIESIGTNAFKDCTGLQTFAIETGSNLTKIGQYALSGTNSLASITIPFIGDKPTSTNPFGYIFKSAIGNPSTYEYYARSYFVPKSLTSITITGGTSIAQNSLRDLTYVTEINLPASIETIGSYALENTGVTSFVVPHSLTALNSKIGTGGDLDLHVESLSHYMSFTQGVIVANDNNKLKLYIGQNEVTNLDLSSMNLTEIGPYKYYKCKDITSVSLPNSVSLIDVYAFYKSGINGISFPTSLTTIKLHAFDGTNITSVTLNPNLETIEAYAFANTQMSTLTVPKEVTTIMGFDHIPSLTTVNFEANSNLETIAGSCFANTGITSITIPASVTTIGASAFYYCTNLTNVSFESGSNLESIEGSSFAYTAITSITIPTSVTSIGAIAFKGASDLETLSFASGTNISSIGREFISGTKINTLEIPSNVTMANGIFTGASYLHNLTCPMRKKWTDLASDSSYVNVTVNSNTICEKGFYQATNVSSIDLSNVTEVGSSAFNSMSALTKVYISSWNNYLSIDYNGSYIDFYHDDRNVDFYVNGTLVSGTFDLSGIDSSITSIPNGAFCFLRSITDLILPTTITSIGDKAFDYCTNLVDMKFKDGNTSPAYTNDLVSIGQYAFRKTDLSSVVISNSTTSIGNYAFSECMNLGVSFESNSTLHALGKYAFYKCSGLTAFEIPSTLTSIGEYAFASTGLQTLSLASNSTLASISMGAFSDCKDLTTLPVFTSSLITLGSAVFNGCTNITTVDLRGANITSIPYRAFKEDSNLTHVYVSGNVTYFGSEAFMKCTELISVESSTNPTYTLEVKSSCFRECAKLEFFGYGDWAAVDTYVEAHVSDSNAVNPDVRDTYMNNHYTEFSKVSLVEDYAFYGCTNFENIRLASSIEKIGKYAFYECENLKYINIPHACTHLDHMSFAGAFENTTKKSGTGLTTLENNIYETYGMAIEFYSGESQITWEYHNSSAGSMFTTKEYCNKTDIKYRNTCDLVFCCQNKDEKSDKYKTGVSKLSVS